MTPRKTAADYAAIAVAPVLIFFMISSLANFLMLILYRGGFQQRLSWILLMYTMGAVCVARIAIERDRTYSLGYAGALGLATFIAMLKFLDSAVFSAFILVLIAYLADLIVRDCTLIDDDVDASDQGLIDSGHLFLRKQVLPNLGERNADHKSQAQIEKGIDAVTSPRAKQRKSHQPGRTVMYLALGALPLFGLGQFLMRNDFATAARAQRLLAFYLFASLSLLVTTSFLGLRRYLRQRKTEMPKDVTVAWLVAGMGLIAGVLFLAYLAPMPGRAIASFELPAFDSPGNLTASRYGWGKEAADRSASNAAKAAENSNAKQKEVDQISAQQGAPPGNVGAGNRSKGPLGNQEGGKKSGEKPRGSSAQSKGQQANSQQAKGQQSNKQQSKGQQPNNQQSKGQQPNNQQAKGQQPKGQQTNSQRAESDSQSSPPQQASDQRKDQRSGDEPRTSEGDDRSTPEPNDTTTPEEPASRESKSDLPPENKESEDPASSSSSPGASELLAGTLSIVGTLIKYIVFAVLVGIVGTFLWMNRHLIREWWENLLGQPGQEQDESFEQFLDEATQVPPRAFASFRNPIGKEADQRRVIVITFQAFEAWTREHGSPRERDETPAEFIRRVSASVPQMSTPATQIVESYNRIVYGRGTATQQDITAASQVWNTMHSRA